MSVQPPPEPPRESLPESPPESLPEASPEPPAEHEDQTPGRRVVVVTQDGMGVAQTPAEGERIVRKEPRNPADAVEHPAKVMRLGAMIKQLLEEVRAAPLDEAGRQRLAEIHRRSISELEQGLSQDLVDELERITLPLSEQTPSEAELRIAQAQLVGWLEGLFHGIQTAIVAQQMAAQAQLQQMRRALPPMPPGPGLPGRPPSDEPGQQSQQSTDNPTGQYL